MSIIKHVPNILSASRFPLSVLLVLFVTYPIRFLVLYVVTGVTDFLDGWLARKYHLKTTFGAKLDSFADAFFGFSLIVALFGRLQLLSQLQWYVLAALVTLGLLKVVNLFYTRRKFGVWSTMHTLANKFTALPFLALVPIMVFTGEITSWLSTTLLVLVICVFLANLEETLIIRRMTQYDTDAESIFNFEKKKNDEI